MHKPWAPGCLYNWTVYIDSWYFQHNYCSFFPPYIKCVYQFTFTEPKTPETGLQVITMELHVIFQAPRIRRWCQDFWNGLFGVRILVETIDTILLKMSRPTVGCMQPPPQWVPGFCRNCKATGSWSDYYFRVLPRLRIVTW